MTPDSNAWTAGLREKDVIMSVNRRLIESLQHFAEIVSRSNALLIDFRRGERAFYLTVK